MRSLLFRGQRGQNLIEFALVFPIILLFLFVIIDFGIAMDRRINLQHAVREGARYAAVQTDSVAIQDRTANQAQSLIDSSDVTVCYRDGSDGNTTPGDAGDYVEVSASFTYDLFILRPVLFGLFGGTSAGTIDMTPSANARLERTVVGGTECP